MDIAYRWFLGFNLGTRIPHFAILSYAFAQRFPSKVFEEIFAWILEEAVKKGYVDARTIVIDATHIMDNANKKKNRKMLAKKTVRRYDEQLRDEINQDRIENGKKPLEDKDDDDKRERQMTVSTIDPECGLFFITANHQQERLS